MPCYDGREKTTEIIYSNGINPQLYHNALDRAKQLEAALCALITELEKNNIADEIITRASKNGSIDLKEFWAKHSKADEERLSKIFNELSEHEKDVILRLIREGGLFKKQNKKHE